MRKLLNATTWIKIIWDREKKCDISVDKNNCLNVNEAQPHFYRQGTSWPIRLAQQAGGTNQTSNGECSLKKNVSATRTKMMISKLIIFFEELSPLLVRLVLLAGRTGRILQGSLHDDRSTGESFSINRNT